MVVGAGGCWAFIIFVVDYRGGSQGSSFPTYLDSGEAQVVVNAWTQAGRQGMYLPWWCCGPTDGVLGGFQVLVLAVKQLFPEFEFMWLVDEAKKNLPLELDFLNEGRNAEKVAQMLKHFDFLKVGGQGNEGMMVC